MHAHEHAKLSHGLQDYDTRSNRGNVWCYLHPMLRLIPWLKHRGTQ